MTRKSFFGLAIATLAVAASCVSPASAGAPIGEVTVPWTVEILGGPYDGEIGVGSISYDPSFVFFGDEVLSPTFGNLTLEMTILGQLFTEADDIDFDAFPELLFEDFEPVFIDLVVSEVGFEIQNLVEIDAPRVDALVIATDLFPAPGGGLQGFALTVPEPASALLLAPMAMWTTRRR
ncbi:hypothetical protein Mal64_09110 [Pseudobythopirellula maris]|uniref:PEP-CTERM protein-sorting domain-containing protein n=1 Tax=Pseudobythopirellula maris TaxID=2527991 RepID=A0A5C5ZTE8_9BACT|nr:hypothetical protein [Pseudobythopirellula maris]TWT90520.1 hypothetical protein Mal64_09110 [Pseudobythopirellula maris]